MTPIEHLFDKMGTDVLGCFLRRRVECGRRSDCTSEESADNLSWLGRPDDSERNADRLSKMGTDNPGRVGTGSHSPAQSVERSFDKS